MEPFFKVLLKEIYSFVTDRVFILFIAFTGLFLVLTVQLFSLQIVHTEEYQKKARPTSHKTQSVDAPRGQIYDRMGRPLAVNETAFCILIDPSIRYSDTDNKELTAYNIYKKMIEILDEREEELLTNIPMTLDPIAFNFDGSDTKEKRFKADMGVKEHESAEKTYKHLRELFGIPKDADPELAERVLGVACSVYEERFRLEPVEIAMNVSDETVAAIEEQNNEFPGVYADVVYMRNYPGGEEFSHILGYIRQISEEEMEANKDKGYDETDMYGKVGLERALEDDLKGKKGEKVIEVDRSGRRVGTVSETPPVPGDKVFLTMDAEFQKDVVEVLEDVLVEIFQARLRGRAGSGNLNQRNLFVKMIESHTIDADRMIRAEEGTVSYNIGRMLLADIGEDKESAEYTKGLVSLFEGGRVSMADLLLAMEETDRLELTDDEKEDLASGALSASTLTMKKVDEKQITPDMANVNPVAGSIVVVDVKDGGVLASANYPNYDNNQLVNQFNNEYYARLQKDPSKPMINRSFSEARAPGSTFKMITGFAGLDSGTVGVNERIRDFGTFTKAGSPYAHCNTRVAGYHGDVEIERALEVSCNYYFYETSYRMGGSKTGNKLGGIHILNDYMEKFGLGLPTGIEISEANPTISGPDFKEESILMNPKATESDASWSDGDTIRTAIGQSLNNYTSATMAKYVSVVANGGKRYSLHFLHEQVSGETGERTLVEPVLEEDIGMSEEIKEKIHEGMRRVTEGERGTARGVFAGFPMTVAGKTGTAQQSGVNHATFAAFAPFEEPEIAIYVMLPFSENDALRSPAAEAAKRVVAAYYNLDEEEVEEEEKLENDEELDEELDEMEIRPKRGVLVP